MPKHDVIAIGASAGGIEALLELLPALPADLPAAILLVIHFPENAVSHIPELLSRKGPLSASHAEDGQAIAPGRIFVASPGLHLMVENERLRLVRGPRENNVRPAIDALLRTSADCYRRRLVGVLSSGTLDDGTAGLLHVKMRGGVAMVQNPDDAMFGGLPASALRYVPVDYTLPASEMAPVLAALAQGRSPKQRGGTSMATTSARNDDDVVARSRQEWEDGIDSADKRSVLTCPECGGVLWELDTTTPMLRFECHTNHAYSVDSLIGAQNSEAESSLWASVRRLEEIHSLAVRLEKHNRAHGDSAAADAFHARAEQAKAQADAVRQILLTGVSA